MATPPTVDAGSDVQGKRGGEVALAGSGAAHADGSRELTYRWRIADASNGELTGLKLTSGPNLEAGLAFGHRETGRGAPEGAIELNGSMRW